MKRNEIIEECARVADFYAKCCENEASKCLGIAPFWATQHVLELVAGDIRQLKNRRERR